ncbi:LysR family transcriptional regulator [Corynebacterium sp. zg-331]|uniref:hydrogen peroxide-inducible genes activator n=1 Tax=unclassified Corynebacterium TaxID=2624378 RepID=UPI00128D119A|nr:MULTISPECIES: hydrogen peroxide-inducible genes activator [unclassified Corynebacterium]MBC3185403.1 LysR family transcriptional regulator [Corynebacterium sp. zg-331]MPV51898.1 LysR family transcriptional regulator [Corynebacterium sp. zg331]
MHHKEYRPTLAQLRTFVTIADNKHFGTAAAKLNISQPSLSQALSALENGIGVQLIERSTRRVIVTPIGERLLPYAKAALDATDIFVAHSRGSYGQLAGPLSLGVIPTIAPYLLPALLPLLQQEYPELEPRIVEDRTTHLLAMLRDGRIDAALLALPSEASGLIDLPLYQEEFVVVVPASHHLAGRDDLTLQSLEELQLLLLNDGHCLHDQIVNLCRRADLNPSEAASAVTQASSLTTIAQLVAGGLGSTLIPLSAVEAECRRPGLSTASFAPGVTAERHIGLVYRASSSRAPEFTKLGATITRAYRATVPLRPSPLDRF